MSDLSRLKSTLANSGMQKDNNALYQTVLALIVEIEKLQKRIDLLESAI